MIESIIRVRQIFQFWRTKNRRTFSGFASYEWTALRSQPSEPGRGCGRRAPARSLPALRSPAWPARRDGSSARVAASLAEGAEMCSGVASLRPHFVLQAFVRMLRYPDPKARTSAATAKNLKYHTKAERNAQRAVQAAARRAEQTSAPHRGCAPPPPPPPPPPSPPPCPVCQLWTVVKADCVLLCVLAR